MFGGRNDFKFLAMFVNDQQSPNSLPSVLKRKPCYVILELFDFNACKHVKALTLNDFHYKQKLTFSFPKEIQKLAATRALAVCHSRVNQCIVIVCGLYIPLFPLEFTAPSLEMKFCQKFLRLPNCLHEPITRNPL